MRVLGSAFPADLPVAPSYDGLVPHYSGRPAVYLGAMAPIAIPASPYEGRPANWWDSKAAVHHATPLHVPVLKIPGPPVVSRIAEVLRHCSGVALADQEVMVRLGTADTTPSDAWPWERAANLSRDLEAAARAEAAWRLSTLQRKLEARMDQSVGIRKRRVRALEAARDEVRATGRTWRLRSDCDGRADC